MSKALKVTVGEKTFRSEGPIETHGSADHRSIEEHQIENLKARVADIERELEAVYTNLLDALQTTDTATRSSKIISVASSAIVVKNNPLEAELVNMPKRVTEQSTTTETHNG